jgi:hypothetical protein
MTGRYSHSGMDAKIKAIETLANYVINSKTPVIPQAGTA